MRVLGSEGEVRNDERLAAELEHMGVADLAEEGYEPALMKTDLTLDMRYGRASPTRSSPLSSGRGTDGIPRVA